MARLLTQAQFARKTKYSRARITQLVKQGVIKLVKGKVDPTQASAAIGANIDRSRRIKAETKSRPAPSPQLELIPTGFNNDQKPGNGSGSFNTHPQSGYGSATESLTAIRRDHEIMKMKLTEYQIMVKRGQLVERKEFDNMLIALGSAIKLAFLNLPRRLASPLKAAVDEKEVEIILRSEIRGVMRILEQAQNAKTKRPGSKNP